MSLAVLSYMKGQRLHRLLDRETRYQRKGTTVGVSAVN